MKKLLAVSIFSILLLSSLGLAQANIDGVYSFKARFIDGKADMENWWGVMVITNPTMSRFFLSPDKKTEKYYVGTMKNDGKFVNLTLTYSYKAMYVGNVHKNMFYMQGTDFVIESEDKKFKEVWVKK
ncbi:MAG: hypothetical protein ABIA04_13255 [Pseudomonadota bacterium]